MNDKPDYNPMEQFAAALGRVVSNSHPERCAAMAYLQASLAQAACQGLINLIMSKNILSREEIQRALDASYDERFKQLSGSNAAVIMPAPTTKSN